MKVMGAEHPHRKRPADLTVYVGSQEVSNCRVCRHQRAAIPLVRWEAQCVDPRVNGTGACNLWHLPKHREVDVKAGICPGYEPSALTRTLRLFGLRKASMR